VTRPPEPRHDAIQLRTAAPAPPKRSLSQNFLVDRNTATAIVTAAAIQPSESVLEIGPGRGALTFGLAEAAARLVAVERDDALAPWLAEQLASHGDRVRIIHADVLEADLAALLAPPGPWVVVGNLPYAITTPILLKLLQHARRFDRAIVMVQREVAQRWCAGPGSRTYGAITVWCQYHCSCRVLRKVRPSCFRPSPSVESALVELRPHSDALPRARDEALLQQVTRAAFGQRRKRAATSLAACRVLPLAREEWEALFRECGIDGRSRAEDISVSQYVALSDAAGRARGASGP